MIKLYAQAAIYKPNKALLSSRPVTQLKSEDVAIHGLPANDDSNQNDNKGQVAVLPSLPKTIRSKTHQINAKHCQAYNALTKWQPSLAAKIHPNYVQTVSLPMQLSMMVQDPFPFKPMGLVHIANEINVFNLPEQDALLEIHTQFGQVYYHKKGWLFEVLTTAKSVRANHPYEQDVLAKSYYLARTRHSEATHVHYASLPSRLPACLVASTNQPGDTTPKAIETLKFSENIGRRYAKISGDYNPIHLYPYTAKLLGFKKAIAHGMYSKALAFSHVAKQLAEETPTGEQLDINQAFCITNTFLQAITLPMCTTLSVDMQERGIGFYLSSDKRGKVRPHLSGLVKAL